MTIDFRRVSPPTLPSPRLHLRQAFALSFRCSLDSSFAAVTPHPLAPTCRLTASANRTAYEHPFELPNPSCLRAEARLPPGDSDRCRPKPAGPRLPRGRPRLATPPTPATTSARPDGFSPVCLCPDTPRHLPVPRCSWNRRSAAAATVTAPAETGRVGLARRSPRRERDSR
jgi:hypothetical protein